MFATAPRACGEMKRRRRSVIRHAAAQRPTIAGDRRCMVQERRCALPQPPTGALETDRGISDLIGNDASARFHFIIDRAEEADDLDL